jgi:hypothetical protein
MVAPKSAGVRLEEFTSTMLSSMNPVPDAASKANLKTSPVTMLAVEAVFPFDTLRKKLER